MTDRRILTSYDFQGTVKSDPQGLFIGAVLAIPTTPAVSEGIVVLYMGETEEGSFENGKFYRYDGENWEFVQIGNEFGLEPGMIVIASEDGNLTTAPVTAEYLNALEYIQSVTSPVQEQLNALGSDVEGLESRMDTAEDNIVQLRNGKQDTITGGATTILTDNLTASRALVSDADGKVAVSEATATEVGYLAGATSNIQIQIDTLSATISAIGGLRMTAVDELPATGESGVIYLVPTSDPEAGNVRDEYIWLDDAWELIGSTQFNLDLVQDETGISINGTNLQDASTARPGLMTAEHVMRLGTAEDDIDNLDDRVTALEQSGGYTLTPATADTLGGVKIGNGINVTEDGTISVDESVIPSDVEVSLSGTNLTVKVNEASGSGDLSGLTENVEASVTALGERMTTAEGNIGQAQTDITALQSRMNDAESEIDQAQTDITNLQGRMTNAEEEIASIKALDFTKSVVTLSRTGWTESEGTSVQDVAVTGVTDDNIVFVAPSPAFCEAYALAGIYATAQGTDTLTFACSNVLGVDVEVNVLIW